MNDILDKSKLEEVLISRWTEFLDQKKLLAFVLVSIRDNQNQFNKIQSKKQASPGIKLSVSRFEPKDSCFETWIEFSISSGKESTIGTCEIHFSYDGNPTLNKIIGTIFKELPES